MFLRTLSLFIVFAWLICPCVDSSEYDDQIKHLHIPTWVQSRFHQTGLIQTYDYAFKLNPFYLRGDFNGDDKPDIAILVRENATQKLGIVVIHFNGQKVFILGAGKPIGNGGDNFNWMTHWRVQRKGETVQGADFKAPLFLKVEALHVEKAGSASALIFWNGQEYVWRQEGD